MTKNDYWELFRLTGKIEYYLKYKESLKKDDKKNRRNCC